MPRISLRELLVFVTLVALAIVSLKYASELWQGLIGLFAMLALFAAIFASIFDRGPRQIFAIGFALGTIGYSLLVMNGHHYKSGDNLVNAELNGYYGQLPTTVLMQALHKAIAEQKPVEVNSGRVLNSTEVANLTQSALSLGSSTVIEQRSFPPLAAMVSTAHYWFGLLFGFLGGTFARYIYVRRSKEQASHPEA